MSDEPNPLQRIFAHYAAQLSDSPGAGRLARLARTARRIPAALLDDLATLIVQLDDVQLVGDDIAIALIDVGYCDEKYTDATEFASALRTRLQRYLRHPCVADNARGVLKEHIRWWGFTLSRASALCRWPAIVLSEHASNGD